MMGGDGGKDFQKIAMKLLNKMRQNITEEEAKEMEMDGGFDLNEVKTILAKSGLKPPTNIIEKFNELDTNKNGLIERSEVGFEEEGEDYLGLGVMAIAAAVFITFLSLGFAGYVDLDADLS